MFYESLLVTVTCVKTYTFCSSGILIHLVLRRVFIVFPCGSKVLGVGCVIIIGLEFVVDLCLLCLSCKLVISKTEPIFYRKNRISNRQKEVSLTFVGGLLLVCSVLSSAVDGADIRQEAKHLAIARQ